MSKLFRDHLQRLRLQSSSRGLENVGNWITQNTYLGGKPFSFVDHEYQEAVVRDASKLVIVRKCSQVGLSELTVRFAVGACNAIPNFTTIYTLPTAGFARTFAKTRIDPVITDSPAARGALNSDVDNSEVKQFGSSFLHIKGTIGTASAISVPADMLVHDEVDFSDSEVMSNYTSRLTHSKYKLVRKFSTPTVSGYGISAEFDHSRRHWNFVKCCHCNHWFIPDYFEHVRLPGFKGESLRQINRNTIQKYIVDDAYVECPQCGKAPDMGIEFREFVCENPDENHIAAGYQIQPFDAPAFITPGDLIKASTSYARYADFINFNLGLPAEDAESAITKEELREMFRPAPPWQFGATVMGLDMGQECTCVIAGITPLGELRVVHMERIDARNVVERRIELCKQYRVIMCVVDLYPFTETVWRMQERDKNVYAAQFVTKRGIETHWVREVEGDNDKSQADVREVQINRNRALDSLLALVRQPDGVLFKDSEEKELLIEQMTDMKRIKVLANRSETGEEVYVWQKSNKKNDHYHHALLYAYMASMLRGMTANVAPIPAILGKMRLKEYKNND